MHKKSQVLHSGRLLWGARAAGLPLDWWSKCKWSLCLFTGVVRNVREKLKIRALKELWKTVLSVMQPLHALSVGMQLVSTATANKPRGRNGPSLSLRLLWVTFKPHLMGEKKNHKLVQERPLLVNGPFRKGIGHNISFNVLNMWGFMGM